MLHDLATNSSSNQTTFFSLNFDDIISPTHAKRNNRLDTSSPNMLSSNRRAPAGRMSKGMSSSSRSPRREVKEPTLSAELSERDMLSPTSGGSRWRYNGNGQLVDSATANWELADELNKMHLSANGDGEDPQVHTPPQSKAHVAALVQFQEASPLETASEASLDSGSSNTLEHSVNIISHSRESSADTSTSALSSTSQTLRGAPLTPLKVGAVGESRNRPHSYSGGLSSTDLTRLQQAGGSPANKGDSWSSPNGTPERQQQADQPTYPSLAAHSNAPRLQDNQQLVSPGPRADEYSGDYQQQRQFNQMPQGHVANYGQGRPNNVPTNMSYRQPPRGFNTQVQIPPVLPSPTNFAYPAPPPPPIPISNPQQQLYDMMLPTPPLDNPVMARLQQQHGVFRGTHQHSASDPAALRDPAALALLNSNLQAFAAGQMYPPTLAPQTALTMFANQFYGAPQEAYSSPELAAAQMMARLQSQYTGAYGMALPGQNVPVSNPAAIAAAAAAGGMSPMGSASTGPSANNRKLGLYKTELCRSWEEKGSCRYGTKCQFAHGEDELRKVSRHPKVGLGTSCPFIAKLIKLFLIQYKTEICRVSTF